jgi:L-fucose isomerase-like protein
MSSLNVCAIGHTPQGFGFGRALDNDLLEVFGVHQDAIEARELIDAAKGFSDEECAEYLNDAMKRTRGLENTPERNRLDFARIYKAYDEFVTSKKIGAIASRCWPDFFTSFGTPVCAVLAMLNDLGVAAACEADMYGALSMWIGMKLSQKAVFFGDPVSLDEKENTITFWHCGTAACSLAREDTGAAIGEHCNRHIGPTMEFGAKESDHAVIFRIGRNPDGTFRFFIVKGKALDRPKQFFGTSSVIETEDSAEKIIHESVLAGWEPHYAVIYGDVSDELQILARMFGCEVTVY